MTEQQARTCCAWCDKDVDPLQTEQVAVHDDSHNEEHCTGHETVCNGCIEAIITMINNQ